MKRLLRYMYLNTNNFLFFLAAKYSYEELGGNDGNRFQAKSFFYIWEVIQHIYDDVHCAHSFSS